MMTQFDIEDREVISIVRSNPNRKVYAEALPPLEVCKDGTIRFARKKFPWKVMIINCIVILGGILCIYGFIHGIASGFDGLDLLYICGAIAYIGMLGGKIFKI